MPEGMPYVSAKGLKGVNSDSIFEAYLERAGLSLDISTLNPEEYAKAMELRGKAKSVTVSRMHNFINGKLGMLIDGTGKNYQKIANMKLLFLFFPQKNKKSKRTKLEFAFCSICKRT